MQKLLTFFQQKFNIYAILNDQSFNDTFTNDSVSFEGLGPDLYYTARGGQDGLTELQKRQVFFFNPKVLIFVFAENICYGYSLDVPWRDIRKYVSGYQAFLDPIHTPGVTY